MMKTLRIFALSILASLAFTITAFATAAFTFSVPTVTATTTAATVSGKVSVPSSAGSLGMTAVEVQILDSSSNILAMQSLFLGTAKSEADTLYAEYAGEIPVALAEGNTYTLRVANYDGGSWTSTTFTVQNSQPDPRPDPTPDPRNDSSSSKPMTYSSFWSGSGNVWTLFRRDKSQVFKAWVCDDAVKANGNNVWYFIGEDGLMINAGLVQDATGNFYSIETNHDGYYGMLRYQNGYYNCNGIMVYLEFNQNHGGSFGAIMNPEGIAQLNAIYGLKRVGFGNETIEYTGKW